MGIYMANNRNTRVPDNFNEAQANINLAHIFNDQNLNKVFPNVPTHKIYSMPNVPTHKIYSMPNAPTHNIELDPIISLIQNYLINYKKYSDCKKKTEFQIIN